jgi:cysteine-rich repeat protein
MARMKFRRPLLCLFALTLLHCGDDGRTTMSSGFTSAGTTTTTNPTTAGTTTSPSTSSTDPTSGSGTTTDATSTTSPVTTTATTTGTTGPDTTSGCDPGSESCPCDGGACDPPLVCENDVCVAPPPPACGDGKVDDGEQCDDGNDVDTDSCLNNCMAATCGDGVVQARAEACDDGNQVDGDGCSTLCAMESCGDGIVQPGEECDDANMVDTDDCLTTCLTATCGDGKLKAGAEECDDGNADDTDACPTTCKNAACGDGFTQTGVEECDDANMVETDACINTCKTAKCGDGKVQAGAEECDDGNMTQTDTCINTCKTAKCGDGQVQAGVDECDDGNNIPGDGCNATCMFECGNDCWSNQGCKTQAGRCIRFTCTTGQNSMDACNSCFGWKPITYQQWMNNGYCADVIQRYRASHGNETRCGQAAATCCATPGACGGADNAWHFFDGANNRFVGPCLGCANDVNCTFWNGTDNGTYSRITACERP